jgi:hypothetical protein
MIKALTWRYASGKAFFVSDVTAVGARRLLVCSVGVGLHLSVTVSGSPATPALLPPNM